MSRQKTSPKDSSDTTGQSNQMRLRLITGLLMAAATIGLVFVGPWPFFARVANVAAIAAWEWHGLTTRNADPLRLAVQILVIAVAGYLTMSGSASAGLAVITIGVIGLLLFPGPGGNRFWSAFGVLYIGLPVVALIWLRLDLVFGVSAVLFLFFVVWASDSGAYFVGRTVGGPPLAQALSPHKTISGAIGGLISSALAAFLFALWLGSGSPFNLMLLGIGLSLCAQLGDIIESAIKRSFDAKDSSQLIPGHGGLLDRIDALLFAAVAAALVALMRGSAHPGEALLIWS